MLVNKTFNRFSKELHNVFQEKVEREKQKLQQILYELENLVKIRDEYGKTFIKVL